jgi:hypothetical protein
MLLEGISMNQNDYLIMDNNVKRVNITSNEDDLILEEISREVLNVLSDIS